MDSLAHDARSNCVDGTVTLKDGRVVDLLWDELAEEMTVWTTGDLRQRIGEFTFKYIEESDDHISSSHYLVVHMNLQGPDRSDAYLRAGIGREVVRRVGSLGRVLFGPEDGSRPSDGSYLIDHGPAFARAMVTDGLAGQQNCQWNGELN